MSLPLASSVPAFKKALTARLRADTTLLADGAAHNDLSVTWGNPHPAVPTDAIIEIGPTRNRTMEYTCAMTQANERYEVEMLISIVKGLRVDREVLWARAYALADAIAASVLSWQESGYDGKCDYAEVKPSSDDEAIDGEVLETSIKFNIAVLARLS